MMSTGDGDRGGESTFDAPSLIHVTAPLPSSVALLGLSLADASTSMSTAATAAAAADGTTRAPSSPSPSFRVRAMYVDDVAEDVILVCEDGITLFVPLHWGDDAAASAAAAPPLHRAASTTTTAAAAACLRTATSAQMWSPPPGAPLCGGSASTSELCLPRRLPAPHEELRRAPSALVAVPVAAPRAMTAGGGSAAAATSVSSSEATPEQPPVMAVYIMECAVLPEGVDCIEASAIPLSRTLAQVLCCPNTLRFREAWYPLRLFCWCCGRNSGVAPRRAGEATPASSPAVEDHHLLCVSSIAVELVRVRRGGTGASPSAPPSPYTSATPSSLLTPSDDDDRACRESAPPTTLASSSAAHRDGSIGGDALRVSTTVLQRVTTRTDWCVFSPRSRVVLCINRARPSVVKPFEVRASPVVHHEQRKTVSGTPAAPPALQTWAELSLSESLCASLHLHCAAGAAASTVSAPAELPLALLQSPHSAARLSAVLGVLTMYGQTLVYHVTSGGGDPVVLLYMHLPTDHAPAASLTHTGGDAFVCVARLSVTEVTSPARLLSRTVTPASSMPAPLCVQVVDNLLVVHVPETAQSAVYDLADRGATVSHVRANANEGGATATWRRTGQPPPTSRHYVLWAAASAASRAWARRRDSSPNSSAAAPASAAGTAAIATVAVRRDGGAVQRPAPSPTMASMVAALTSSVLELTAGDALAAAAAPTAASTAPLLLPLYCCAVTGDNEDATPVSYRDLLWLTESRVPLALNVSDGMLHLCCVDTARVAEWRLLTQMSHGTADADADADAPPCDHAVAAVCAYVSLVCRRQKPFATASVSGGGVFLPFLEEVTRQIVGLLDGADDGVPAASAAAAAADHVQVDVLRYVFDTAASGGRDTDMVQLQTLWSSLLECVTVESELVARCVAATAPPPSSFSCECEATGDTTAALQQLVVQHVFAPVWSALQQSSSSPPPLHGRQRLEGLLCEYVRQLHSIGAAIGPQLHYLLLRVVLSDAGDTPVDSASAHPPSNTTTAAAAARRVNDLLRLGTVERSDTTARWLLDWWGRCHLVAAAAAAAACPVADEDTADVVHPASPAGGGAAEELDFVFQEAVRLLESCGALLEVAEAFSWRSDFTAAAAVLQRVPRHCSPATVPVVVPWPAPSHHRQTRLLSWDSLALAVLDGTWQSVRWAEEALYMHTCGAALAPAAQGYTTAAATATAAAATTERTSATSHSWTLHALQKRVGAAHRVYVAVATMLLGHPTSTPSSPTYEAAHRTQESAVVADDAAHLAGLYQAHEVRYEKLRRQMEDNWQTLRRRGGCA
ncbi:hypothetical protein NESM_000431900 [Novymonas esmeraldas]|uniref:Uncharacterized protein n=1 Tax=Novymonas esmeraldas TaxID=1808958 RepID=A0AAW0EP71_9TRYP